MNTVTKWKPSAIEVWLSQVNLQVTCRVVAEDESTRELHVDSLSMRGAQREVTGYLIGLGLKPVGRWEIEQVDGNGDALETVRKFRPSGPAMKDPIVPSDVRQRVRGGPEAAAKLTRVAEHKRRTGVRRT
jgi:hypothetical protein